MFIVRRTRCPPGLSPEPLCRVHLQKVSACRSQIHLARAIAILVQTNSYMGPVWSDAAGGGWHDWLGHLQVF